MKQYSVKIVSNTMVLPEFGRSHGRRAVETRLMWLNAPVMSQTARPGQFIMIRCSNATVLPRPFSIFQSHGSDIAVIYTVWEGGKGTGWLKDRRTGDTVEIFGPLGNAFSINTNTRKLLLVAGGIGLAPLFFLAEESLKKQMSVTFLYGTPNRNRYPIPPEMRPVTATEDGSSGYKGYVTDLIPRYAGDADQVFICGPMEMYKSIAQKQKALNLAGKPIQLSLEIRMGCGVGACYGCSVKTISGMKRVCREGPVFNLDEIIWEGL